MSGSRARGGPSHLLVAFGSRLGNNPSTRTATAADAPRREVLERAARQGAGGGRSGMAESNATVTLRVGDVAPDFTLPATAVAGSKTVSLSDFRGKKHVVLAFFPLAFTPT